jgi:heavy metal sensor kinase
MSSSRRPRRFLMKFSRLLVPPRATLALRLTLWYAGVFAVTAVLAFFLFYLLITNPVRTRIDTDLLRQSDEYNTVLSLQGIGALQRFAVLRAQAAGEEKIFIRLLYPSGVAFSSSNAAHWRDLGVNHQAVRAVANHSGDVIETVKLDHHRYGVRVLYSLLGQGVVLQLGQALDVEARLFEGFKPIFILAMSVVICFAAAVGWFMARRALAGVADVTRTARRITSGDLSQRVPIRRHGDEIDQLALTFNQMLDRIAALVGEIREMNDNIAHDLRSPLTRIRGVAEMTLLNGLGLDDFKHMAGDTIEECDRLLDMINTMLLISQTQAGTATPAQESLDLALLLSQAIDLFQPLAEDRQVRLVADLPERCPLTGDARMLQRLVANLLDNAIKYSSQGGKVTVDLICAVQGKGSHRLTIGDSGAGISEADLPHIFKRFFRCDQSRSTQGSGLGLSLAQAIARAHGGRIEVQSTPGEGSRFTVVLPCDPA